MYKLCVLYPPPHDPVAFRAYYEGTHLPLAAKLPGLLSSEYAFDLKGQGKDSPYFCIFQAVFADAAAMAAAMQSTEGQAVAADVANYATGGATVLHFEILGTGQ